MIINSDNTDIYENISVFNNIYNFCIVFVNIVWIIILLFKIKTK